MCFKKIKSLFEEDKIVIPDKPILTIEEEYITRYPRANVNYGARPFVFKDIGKTKTIQVNMDIRNFFCPVDFNTRLITARNGLDQGTDDEKALKCLKWVIDHIKYTSDETQEGYAEYWQFAFETLTTYRGDCEDGSVLLKNLCDAAGVSFWKTRLSAGPVKGGNHAYVTYYYVDTLKIEEIWVKNKTVLLDWCYNPDRETPIKDRPSYKDNELYEGPVWFSTDGINSYGEQGKIAARMKKL